MKVTEVTKRMHMWTVGGHTASGWQTRTMDDTSPPPMVRHVPNWCRLRVHRKPAPGLRLPGHTKTVKSHNPRLRGCYTHVDGWNTTCSCGWVGNNPYPSEGRARAAFLPHQAQVLTSRTLSEVKNLARINTLEDKLGERMPWTWRNGIADAELVGMPPDQARTRLDRWAKALGAEVSTRRSHHRLGVFSSAEDGPIHGIEIRTDLPGERDTP